MTFTRRVATALAALATVFAAAPAAAGPSVDIDRIVFFGDSLSDTGNVWYATGGFPPPPYNQGSGGAGPDFTGGQWSDPLGPSWPTVFAGRFGLTATPSLVPGGNNYAWGGARTGINPLFPSPGQVPYLDQQVGLYALNIAAGAPAPTSTTLASVVIGGNDVANNLGDAAALSAGISSITAQLSTLYGLGVRQFLVANVPDIGATPRFQEIDMVAPGTAAFATSWTTVWNDALADALGTLALPGADLYFLDTFGFGRDPAVLARFANTTDACFTGTAVCADPASYFYWDSFHPSSTAHALIARQALAAVPEPDTIALLLLALGAMTLSARRRRRA